VSPRSPRRVTIWRYIGLAFGLLLVAWLPNVSRPGTHVEGCPEGCVTSDARQEGPLRVLSLNLLHGFPRFEHLDRRLELIVDAIRHHDPDLVCLQEAPWHWGSAARDLAEQTDLNYLYLRANGNRWTLLFEEGEAILSRYPLHDAAFVELKPRAGTFEHRVVLGATAITPWGNVRVYVTHLTHGDPSVNQAQAGALAAFVDGSAGMSALVAGDFNAREDSPQIQALLTGEDSTRTGWIDTYRAVHPTEAGQTCCVDDLQRPDEVLEKRIDYIFFVPGTTPGHVVASQPVLDRAIDNGDGWLWASDHAGLLTTLSLGP
jgi:endonuclease/exonuclease/phosphatase family metal-dependent hydrolase